MIDLKIGDDFDLEFGPSGDLATVTGTALVDQTVRIAVKNYYDSIIGTRNPDVVLYKVRMQTQRIVSALSDIAVVRELKVYYDDDKHDTLVIELTYDDTSSTLTV